MANAKLDRLPTTLLANAGQSCISIQRVYVQSRLYSAFRDALVGYVKDKVKIGDPRDRERMIGPMIAPEAAHLIGEKFNTHPNKSGRVLGKDS